MQFQKPAVEQTQKLKLSPQMLQSIKIMSLPLFDLRARIEQELEENPALERTEDEKTLSIDSTLDSSFDSTPEKSDEDSYFENTSDPGTISTYDQDASNAKQSFMENALSQPETLQDHLVWQLRLQPLSHELIDIGELLIHNLDMNGFHIEEPQYLLSPEQCEHIHTLIPMIREFDPVGCCTSNYIESLEVQASLLEDVPQSIYVIIREYLSVLSKGKVQEIAGKLSVPPEEVEHCRHILRSLTPFPGQEYTHIHPGYVVPDVIVIREKDDWRIIVNEDELPVLGLNNFFSEIEENRKSKEASDFVRTKIRDARWFINSIRQRNNTLQKVAVSIVKYQRDFFLTGPKGIVPLILKDVAEDIGVHEATISRLTRGKYMQTEYGIFELKYFFTNAVKGFRGGGGAYGKVAVKEIIREILETQSNFSDQKISDLLEKRGIKIARRTVTKYRKELHISSSYER